MSNILLNKKKTVFNNRAYRKDMIFVFTMLLIPLAHYAIFTLYIDSYSFVLAFQSPTGEWTLGTLKAMFFEVFSAGAVMNVAIRNTLLFFAKDLLIIPFQLLISYFLYKKIKCGKFFRVIFYLPSIISSVVMVSMFREFIKPDGPFGIIMQKLGVNPVPKFLDNSDYANWTVMFYTIWTGWGGNMLLFSGALARIPIGVLESARLDGVTPSREFFQIIIPLVWSTMSTFIILSFTGMFNAGGPLLLFTGGKYNTWTISYWIYDRLKYGGVSQYNFVAAIGMIFSAMGIPIMLLCKWIVNRVPSVEY